MAKFLVIGGTAFVGRRLVEAALRAGHDVTLFNRGKTDPAAFPGTKSIRGDRERDLELLREHRWDVVVDTCGYLPQFVGASAAFLRERTERYVFISSVSVYKDWSRRNQDETAQTWNPPGGKISERTAELYGPLKVACEQEVRKAFGARAIIIRPGLIVGPFDPTDRFTYWPVRVSRGGEILAPGDPGRLVQTIDARDLAQWIVPLACGGKSGIFNACGPQVPFQKILEECRQETGAAGSFVWVGSEFLLKENVAPYSDLPLWIPGVDDSFDAAAARGLGLTFRPLRETVRDTFAWHASSSRERALKAGLDADRERRLLALWRRADG